MSKTIKRRSLEKVIGRVEPNYTCVDFFCFARTKFLFVARIHTMATLLFFSFSFYLFAHLIYRSSEGSSSQEQIASESSTPEQPNSSEFFPLEKLNSDDNCNKDAPINTNNNNNIEQGQDVNTTKTADQVTKYDTSATSSSTVDHRQSAAVNEIDDMKRAHAKQLIERYFYQLSSGCGNPHCTNKNCASSGQFEKLTPNQAAAKAIQLFSEDAKFCDFPANKSARISVDQTDSGETQSIVANADTTQDIHDDIYR